MVANKRREYLDSLQPNDLLTTVDVAEILKVSTRTVEKWRREKKPPEYYKFGHKTIRYKVKDVLQLINNNKGEKLNGH
tara:strand:+ start:5278 stop:5511 length:234 start_codon:yes stop_codon:yes gene_type:complete